MRKAGFTCLSRKGGYSVSARARLLTTESYVKESCVTSPKITVRWYHKLILIACSLLISVILVEVAARVFRLIPVQSDTEYRAVSRRVGELGNPYEKFTTSGFVAGNNELKVKIRQNKLGFRGDDIDKTPPKGAQRFLLFGDPYTASWEVSEGQRYQTG
jgi:hypothetical protein